MYFEASLMKFTFDEITEATTSYFQSDKPSAVTEEMVPLPKILTPSAEMKNETWTDSTLEKALRRSVFGHSHSRIEYDRWAHLTNGLGFFSPIEKEMERSVADASPQMVTEFQPFNKDNVGDNTHFAKIMFGCSNIVLQTRKQIRCSDDMN